MRAGFEWGVRVADTADIANIANIDIKTQVAISLQVTFKLFASLAIYLPPVAVRNVLELEVDEGTTPIGLIERFAVPRSEVHLALVNGVYLPASGWTVPLKPGDALALWPPVAGG